MKLLLKGGRVIDPSQNIDTVTDILIENGKISLIQQGITLPEADSGDDVKIFNVNDTIVTPGLIDMHTHLREPGFEYKETIRTGSEAAVAGGFTSIACMANTNPVNDTRSVTEFIHKQARLAALANVYPIAAISKGQEGKVLTEFGDLKDAGAVAFSDDGNPVTDSGLMRHALEYAFSFDMPVISHCEDTALSSGGLMHEGFMATQLGLQGIPGIAEDIMVERDIRLADFTKTRVHIAHVSTAGSVRAIREARSAGINVTAETAPHYFTLTDEALKGFSTNFKMYPPLRGSDDVEAIKEGLRDGTIDVIASDHAPHSSVEKDVEFEYAANGIIGLETTLPLCLKLVDEGILTIAQLIEKLSVNPAHILRIPKGSLKTGADADITVIDMHKRWTVDANQFRSKGRNCPFNGWELKGNVVMTIVGGDVKYAAPKLGV
ncbi:MAG TPA: dihydroorotase [Syntrophales bacterium]|nr:dihydroorotase [Syntrophales bacterium]HPQ45316.1 dihydroorotase [Syntrophales bacterium]